MSQNTGTLVGAPIRPNDSADQYPSALQSEIKGGAHSVNAIADMNAIGAWLREAGMTCYVIANGTTYQLQNDLVTWAVYEQPAGGGAGSGGDSDSVSLLSGNFGAWTPLNSPSGETVDVITLSFKSDLSAFPTRTITYLMGEFSLNSGFTGTTITLGNLPINSRPKANLKRYFIVANIEMYLLMNTDGDVSIASKDGFNLPVNNADEPYYIDTFFQPLVAYSYSATRTESFTRNNCGSGSSGSTVSYSQTYNSTVSQADANAQAAGDTNFETAGQAFANSTGTCTVNPPAPTNNVSVSNGNASPVTVELHGAEDYTFGPIASGGSAAELVGNYTYDNVEVLTGVAGAKTVTVNGVTQTGTEHAFIFDSVTAPITISVE